MRRKIIKAMIGKIIPFGRKGWDIYFAPDNGTWLTMYRADHPGIVPRVGDVVTVTVPQVIKIERLKK